MQHQWRLTHRHRWQASSHRAFLTTKKMGASLLAMGSDHPTSMAPDTPPSLASQLPQGIFDHKENGSEPAR
ncbi:hypothetical protein ACVWYU_004584, partial [Pseudomonas sp. TE12234]